MTHAQRPRDTSLDGLRGIDVVAMLLVNFQTPAGPWLLRHAPWHGLTIADVVFPVFLLLVGISAAMAAGSGRHVPWPMALSRTAMLFAIGLGLNVLLTPSADIAMLRWAGVLQRIAIVYLACFIVTRTIAGATRPLILALAIFALHTMVLLLVPAPGASAPSLAAGEGVSAWLDQMLLPGRILRGDWDPEGVLSTVPAIATGLIGIALGRWVAAGVSHRRIAALSAALLAAGLVSTTGLPVNKALWTASFALICCGLGGLLWMALRSAWPIIRASAPARQLVTAGRMALMVYVVHMLLIVAIQLPVAQGRTLWEAIPAAITATGLPPWCASLLFAALATALSWMLALALFRRGINLKV